MTDYATLIAATSGLTHWYHFDEASGTLVDSIGANNAATFVGTMVYGGSSAVDATGKSIDTTAGRAETGAFADMAGTAAFTMEVWIKPVSAVAGSGTRIIGSESGTNRGASMRWASGNQIIFYRGDSLGNVDGIANAVTLGVWHHVIMTYDGTTMTLYRDRVSRGTSASSRITTSGNFEIGGPSTAVGGTAFFPGLIDEVSIYNRALTLAEVQAHYDAAVNTPLGGSTAGLGGATGALAARALLTGSSAAAGAATGDAAAASQVTGTAAAIGAATSAITATPLLSGSSPATAPAAAGITAPPLLAGSAPGTGAATGSARSTTGLTGASLAIGSTAGAVTAATALSGSSTGTAGATGQATATAMAVGSASGAGSMSGVAGTTPRLGGSFGATAALGGLLTAAGQIVGASSGASDATGGLNAPSRLTGVAPATGSSDGSARAAPALFGSADAQTSMTGLPGQRPWVHGVATATGGMTGIFIPGQTVFAPVRPGHAAWPRRGRVARAPAR